MKKRIWRICYQGILPVVLFLVTLWGVFRGEDLYDVLRELASADLCFIIPAFLCVILFILGESVVIFYLMGTLRTRVPFSHCCLYSFVGFFYSCITPSASGGQPMQVLSMRRDQVPVAVSTVVLAVVTITYKLVLVLIGIAIIVLRPSTLMFYLDPVMAVIYLGLALNVICVSLLLLLVFHPNLIRSSVRILVKFWGRIRRRPVSSRSFDRIERVIAQYHGSAEFLRTHPMVIVRVFLITLLQRCFLFVITWLTYRAFSLTGHTLSQITCLQAMISVATDMLPLPGGMGISEALFLDIFSPIFTADLVLPAMLISRGISYYTQLILSGIMTVTASLFLNSRRKDVIDS